ncbi:hypothetical protein EON64_15590 [archaeon]|nr:MAG: hypothetical protein EON64_15590 [archaeon]
MSHKWALPKQDFNAPDLYLPLMSFVTYILLCGLDRGLHAGFSPDVIIQATWRCLALLLLELAAMRLSLGALGVITPLLDCAAYAGYKFVSLCLILLVRLLSRSVAVLLSLYLAGVLGFFLLKTLAAVVPPAAVAGAGPGGGTQRYVVLLSLAGAELALVLIMSLL